MSDRSVVYEYEWAGGRRKENMYEMFKKLECTLEEWRQIRDHCAKKRILFYASVDYLAGVDMAEELGVPAYKLSSWDVTNIPLIRKMAKTGKPIQVDLGPAQLQEIAELINIVRSEGNENIVLVHCSHSSTPEGVNIRTVPYLQQAFGLPVGYSADSRDPTPDLLALALGAHLIEKRLTLDHTYPGHHHIKALEPHEFRDYVSMIRKGEKMLGQYAVKPSEQDLEMREKYFVSIVAEVDIPKGSVITPEMLSCKRPGTGLPPSFIEMIVGRTARRHIKRNELIKWDDI